MTANTHITDRAGRLAALLTNLHLALALLGSTRPGSDLSPAHDALRTEATRRVGIAATTQEAADTRAFHARYKTTPDFIAAGKLDNLIDSLADHELVPGGVYYLAAALTGTNAWDLRNGEENTLPDTRAHMWEATR